MPYEDYPENKVEFSYASIEEAFPNIDPQHKPFGEFVIVQIRRPLDMTKGGILLSDDSKKAEQDVTQVAKVIAIGPAAFRNRATGELWYGEEWYKPGDFVRVPRYGGDRWKITHSTKEPARKMASGLHVPAKETKTEIEFALFMDKDIRLQVTDPLKVKSLL